MTRIHITGCPRSGTTLMMELMRTCFENDGYCQHEMSIFEQPPGHPNLFFSKQPSDIRRVKPLLYFDRNLHIINMVRDPRSVISSIHKSFPDIYFCNYRVWNECNIKGKQLLHHPRFMQIRYEDLSQSADDVQIAINEFFPFLTKKYNFSDYHSIAHPSDESDSAMGGVRKISSNRILSWKNHLPRVKYEYERFPELADILIELGYELDKSWLQVLDDVEEVKGKCRYPDKANRLKYFESYIRNGLKMIKYLFTLQKNYHSPNLKN